MSTRRTFLRATLTGLLLTRVAAVDAKDPADGNADAVALSPSDPNARAMDFTLDASKVDRNRYPNYKGGKCASCKAFQRSSTPGMGTCQTFSGRLVPSGGWCAAYKARK
jgi:hypothetical protein